METCPHPGKYHESSDGTCVLLPHPQASTCFARKQGYVIARTDSVKDCREIILSLNACTGADDPQPSELARLRAEVERLRGALHSVVTNWEESTPDDERRAFVRAANAARTGLDGTSKASPEAYL